MTTNMTTAITTIIKPLSDLIIKKILQFVLIGKYDINEYDKYQYKVDQLSSIYSMKYKDNNIDVVIKQLSFVCKTWAIKIIPYLDYPFYHIVGIQDIYDPLIPTVSRFGISRQLVEFNNQIEFNRISILISDLYHNNIQARADSDSLAILNGKYIPENKRGYKPMLSNLFFLSYGFQTYFKLVIDKVNESSYFFEKLSHLTIQIENQAEMSCLRKMLYQIPTIKSLNVILFNQLSSTNSNNNNGSTITNLMTTSAPNVSQDNIPASTNTSNIITLGLSVSIETHPSLEKISFSKGSFHLPLNAIDKFKEINFNNVIIESNVDTTTTTTTTTTTNNSLSKFIENNLNSLKRITIRDFAILNLNSNQYDESSNEIITIFQLLSKSKVLEHLDIKTVSIPNQLIKDLLIGCNSLKELIIKVNQIDIQDTIDGGDLQILELNDNHSNLIEYSFNSNFKNYSTGFTSILPISKSIKSISIPNLTNSLLQKPPSHCLINNLKSIIHDGSQTRNFNYLIGLIKDTKSLEKLVIKSIKLNNEETKKDWIQLFNVINENKTLITLHLLECTLINDDLIDQFIKSNHSSIVNIKLHNVNFKVSSFFENKTLVYVNLKANISDINQLLVKTSVIKQLKVTIQDYTPNNFTEILIKCLKRVKSGTCIQFNRSIFYKPSLLKHLKNYSYPISNY